MTLFSSMHYDVHDILHLLTQPSFACWQILQVFLLSAEVLTLYSIGYFLDHDIIFYF